MEEISCLQLSLFCVRGYLTTLLVIGVTDRWTICWLTNWKFSWRNIKITNVVQQNSRWPHTDCNQTAPSSQPITLPLRHPVELSCISHLHNPLFVRLRRCFTRFLDISRYDVGGKCRLYVHPDRKVVHTYQSIRFRIPYILVLRWGKIRRQRFFSQYLGFPVSTFPSTLHKRVFLFFH